jgi:hypothetical protein
MCAREGTVRTGITSRSAHATTTRQRVCSLPTKQSTEVAVNMLLAVQGGRAKTAFPPPFQETP